MCVQAFEVSPPPPRPRRAVRETRNMVGLGGLEPPTSPLSGVRSNHLSYRPDVAFRNAGRSRWWSLSGSNRRPPACKAGALPAELKPRDAGRSLESPSGFLELRMQVSCAGAWQQCCRFSKGGDPAAPSDTATLLRLHPSHRPHRGKRPPEG